MKNAPKHCNAEMSIVGGYQCGGAESWARFACICGHVQSIYGIIGGDEHGSVWCPRRQPAQQIGRTQHGYDSKPKMIVMMCVVPNGVLCRGLSEDVKVFDNLLYATPDIAVQLIGKRFSTYRIHFNMPPEVTR